ncbi:hypothetical protein MC885_019578 [Smutsia gigantea]|nr:hypothetical protein MC885_019578 [Smutsia gigantea]
MGAFKNVRFGLAACECVGEAPAAALLERSRRGSRSGFVSLISALGCSVWPQNGPLADCRSDAKIQEYRRKEGCLPTNTPEVNMETKGNRWLRVTVLPGCVGCRTVAALASWTVRDVKERISAETGFPVAEQRLWLGDRELSDWIKIGDLTSKNCHLFVNLQSKGLKGGGIILTLPGVYAMFSCMKIMF